MEQNWKVSYIISKGSKSSEEKGNQKGGPVLKTNKKLPGKAPYLIDTESMTGNIDLTSSQS
jgi:hypothetical protein